MISTTETSASTFSFSPLPTGTYTLQAMKSGWDTTSETVSVTADATGVNIALYPTSWEVLNISADNIVLSEVGSTDADFSNPVKMFAGGQLGGQSRILSADLQSPFSWTTYSVPTSDALIGSQGVSTPIGLIAIDSNSMVWNKATASGSWSFTIDLGSGQISSINAWGQLISFEVLTSGGLIKQTLTGGALFTTKTLPGAIVANKVTHLGNDVANNIWMAGTESGTAVVKTYASGNWATLGDTASTIPAAEVPTAFVTMSSRPSIIGTANGTIYTSVDYNSPGVNWTRDLSGVPYAIRGGYISSGVSSSLVGVFVCGDYGLIMRHK